MAESSIAATERRRFVDRRLLIGEFLEFLALTGIAVAEPVLTAFRDGADVFVLRNAGPVDVLLFTLAVVLGPPVVLWALLQGLAAAVPSRRDLVRRSLLAGLVAIVAIRVAYLSGAPPQLLVVGFTAAVALTFSLALRRWPVVREWLRLLAVFPVAVAVFFVATDPVASLVFGDGSGGAGAARIARPDPMVVLLLDELPTVSLLDDDNRISASQFPNLAAFADDATWYRNNTSVAPSTPQAVPALLTGRLPTSTETLPSAEQHPDNLFTALRGTYRMHVQEGATRLCPDDLCARTTTSDRPVTALLDDALALWSDQLAADEDDRSGDFTVRQSDPNAPTTFERFLEGLDTGDRDRPTLDLHHALYPHQPWFHLPSGRYYEAPFVAEGLEPPNYRWVDEPAAASGLQRHLLQARHADALVGQLMARLRADDRYDDSLIVVTADHGAAFTAGEPVRGLSTGNAAEVMWTPLLIKAPSQTEGRIDEQPVQAIDLLPTIADHLDMDLPFDTDGSSVLEGADPTDDADTIDERQFFEWRLNTVPADEDGLVHIDGRAGYQAMLDLPARGQGDDPELRFYRFGRHGDLVGQRVTDLTVGDPLVGTGFVDQRRALAAVDPARSPVPVYLSGEVPAEGSVDVAVAVNGVIGGWGHTESAEAARRQHFWAMIPPALLVPGPNQVDLYVIDRRPGTQADGGAGSATLLPVPAT